MEIIFAVLAFLMFFVAMSLGLLLQKKPLKGSCGGVAKLMGNEDCEICGGNPNDCDNFNQQQSTQTVAEVDHSSATDLGYDVSGKS